MVLMDRSDLLQMWARLQSEALANPDTPTVMLIVSQDVDALAACSQFTRLLEAEPIAHKVVPVKDYTDLLDRVYVEHIVDSTELRSIILFNCGGIIDLKDNMQSKLGPVQSGGRSVEDLPHPDCRWFIFDSHRPYNLENVLESSDKVFVVHDGERNDDMEELLEQADILYADEEEDDYSDEEEEPPTQRRKINLDEYSAMSPDSRQERRALMRRLARRYYSTSWHGTAASLLVYSLVQALNKTSNELLWLAIIGLTDQYVHDRLDYEKYVHGAQMLQAEVASLNQDSEQVEQVSDSASGTAVAVRQHVATSMRLESVLELRLSLLRHWSLYEAIYHSSYFAARLGLYQQKGQSKLDEWLARMGIPLEQCKQSYGYMRKDVKDSVYEKMNQYGSEFGLINLTYPSFRRVTSYATTISASDVVIAVNAQLEGTRDDNGEGVSSLSFNAASATLVDPTERLPVVSEGIERAKQQQRAIVATGNAVITQKKYSDMGDFYKATLPQSSEVVRFLHPQAITKLALFVADAIREGKSKAEPKPLVLAALDVERQIYMVVAVLGSSRYWKNGGRNSFGSAFHTCATQGRAHIAHDGFESSVCQVAAADLDNFWAALSVTYKP